MNCKSVESRICAYIDGELTKTEVMAVRNHLRDCAACASEEKEMRLIRLMVRDLNVPEPSDELANRILNRVFQEDEVPVSSASWWKRLRFSFSLVAVGATAAIVVFAFQHTRSSSSSNVSAQNVELEIARDRMMMRDNDVTGGAPIYSASYVSR